MKFTSIIAVLAFAVAASATEPTTTAPAGHTATPATPPVKMAQADAKKDAAPAAAVVADAASGDATKAPAKKGKKKTAAKK